MVKFLPVILLAGSALARSTLQPVQDDGLVELPDGKIQGNVFDDHLAFYGVPYARAPVGDLRWKKPEDPLPWADVMYKPDPLEVPGCPQDLAHPVSSPKVSEDCLYLHIYAPLPSNIESNNNKPKKRPVMVWIHGGSWIHGSGNSQLYNGRHLVKESGVVVVALNYRLGSFGFLFDKNHPDDIVGNQAIYDHIKALEWIQANIELFHGDPDQVTIYGESAGGQSVATLLSLDDKYSHLFQKAMVQSAPFGIPFRSKSEATDEYQTFLKELGCNDIACAKNKSMNDLLKAQDKVRGIIDRSLLSSAFEAWTPTLNTELLKEHPFYELQNGKSKGKDVIFGHTTGEGAVFIYSIFRHRVGKTEYKTALNALFGLKDANKIFDEFPPDCRTINRNCDLRPKLALIAGSYLFDCPMRKAFSNRAKSSLGWSGRSYYYLFDHPVNELPGIPNDAFEVCGKVSCHGAELPYMFNTFEEMNLKPSNSEKALATKLVKYWTDFAYNGSPNNQKQNCWSQWLDQPTDTCQDGQMSPAFNAVHLTTGTFTDITDPGEVAFRCDFWDRLDSYLEH